MTRNISTKLVKPGDVLALNVTSKNGSILLSTGVKLTKEYIEKLRKIGVISITIE